MDTATSNVPPRRKKAEDKNLSNGDAKGTQHVNNDDDDDYYEDDDDDVLGTGFLDSDLDLGGTNGPSSSLNLQPTTLRNVESAATVRASNTQKNGDYDSLSDLFDPPPSPPRSEPNGILPPKSNANVANKNGLPNGQPSPPPPQSNLPKPKVVQDRMVSWDKNIVDSPAAMPPSRNGNSRTTIWQPSLGNATTTKDGSTSPPRTTIDWSGFLESSSPKPRTMTAGSSMRKINLEQLVREASPLETEAETHIFQELEQRTPSRGRANTGTSSLLSNVPDDNVHNFGTTSDHNSANNISINPAAFERVSDFVDSNASAAPITESNNPSVHSSGTAPSKEPSVRMPSTRPPLHSGGGTKPLLKRTKTIEETLYGLEATMRAIHDEGKQDSNKPEESLISAASGGRPRLFSKDATQPQGSADILAQNANVLFSRPVPKRAPSERNCGDNKPDSASNSTNITTVDSNVKKSGSRWNLFADSSNHSKDSTERKKKSDDDSIDIEVAMPPTQTPIKEVSTCSNGNNSSNKKHESFKPDDVLMEKEDYEFVNDFLRPRKASIIFYCKTAVLYLMIPATCVAAILFYFAENPPTGKAGPDGKHDSNENIASASWWIIFVCVRQVITFSLARATEALIIDFLSLRTRWTLRIFGPVITLFIVQSKGWPFTLFSWALFDYALLQGPREYASHWLCWQSTIGLFNKSNPAGNVVRSIWNKRALAVSVSLGIVVAIKRLMMGLYLGRQTFAHYGEELAQLMSKMVLVSQVATLGRHLEKTHARESRDPVVQPTPIPSWSLRSLMEDSTEEVPGADTTQDAPLTPKGDGPKNVIDADNRDAYTGDLKDSERIKIVQLLDEWEEPVRKLEQPRDITISAVLQFRRALDFMDIDFPFSVSFGLADSRESCIQSSQQVYQRLLSETPAGEVLHFNTIALVAADRNGNLDRDKLKDLVRLFRPERDGQLSMIDFVKSVDSVYKSVRLLRATIENSSQIDHAFENIFNVFFYITIACIILAQIGFNPHAIYLSLSSFILAFAFMIGSASAKYFEGLLFILVQRPYGIGDRIHVASAQSQSSSSGAQGWVVENVSLFKTTVRLGATNERATISNGALAGSRIINASRSPQAIMYVNLKFGVDVPYEKIQVFKSVVERFVKARPREWVAMSGFRSSRVEADLGFIEYVITVQHREAWASIVQLLQSQSDLASFCLEVSKKMGMRYVSPPLPVNLAWNQSMPPIDADALKSLQPHHQQTESLGSSAFQDIAALFDKRD